MAAVGRARQKAESPIKSPLPSALYVQASERRFVFIVGVDTAETGCLKFRAQDGIQIRQKVPHPPCVFQ